MDFLRIFITLYLLFISPIIQALPTTKPNPGLALIHGTRDHREDAYGGYWKADFIETLSQGLPQPENHYVVHCNFNHYMWHEEAGFCVANQLLAFIDEKNITALTVYTHSNGANVIRWILSNPTYDARFMRLKEVISKVIAIAPSSAGTPLADEVINGGVFEVGVGWLLGYQADSIKQQRVGDMLIYNQELLLGGVGRPKLPVPFKPIVGTEVSASPFSSANYCNGYLLNSALKITKLYLDSCADGFLDCASQAYAGDVWFYDYERTENKEPLNHNQSRYACFGLDSILISALAMEGAAQ